MRQVTAAVIVEKGQLFLVRRARSEALAGCWELPGGKIEDGETLQECLRRELLEELAMQTTVGAELVRTVYQYEHGSFEMVALRTERLSGFALSVHDSFVWASPEDAVCLDLAPADIELVGRLISLGYWR